MGNDVSKVNKHKIKSYDELTREMKNAGVESMQCAIFIDFSKSNNWTGEKTYGRPLHDPQMTQTPYEQVLLNLAPIMSNFDSDDLYPVYRFGCVESKDVSVLPLLFPQVQNEHFRGAEAIRHAYRQAVQFVQLSGPTTLAPCIKRGMDICTAYRAAGTPEHVVLIILTDGDMTDEERDRRMVCEASKFPLSISVIGIGDGPFAKMERLDNLKKGRTFDNFKFTDFTSFTRRAGRSENPELLLATEVFMEVADQHRAIRQLGYLRQ